MMKQNALIFASHNNNKLKEISALLPEYISLTNLFELNFHDEIIESGVTLEENALIKAKCIYEKYNQSCFADDSGLEIEALNFQPGVFSARFAGSEKNDEANIDKVLNLLKNHSNRNACFRTVIALVTEDKEYLFEGIIKGKICKEKKGNNGFGYDPIFIPDGLNKTFAELSKDEKNKISHRAIAIKKLVDFLSD